jgi:hypothetical protein
MTTRNHIVKQLDQLFNAVEAKYGYNASRAYMSGCLYSIIAGVVQRDLPEDRLPHVESWLDQLIKQNTEG